MKLIRNQTEDGSCKYALILLEKMDASERSEVVETVPDDHVTIAGEHILLGNESPSDQFFVLKYKDVFAHTALAAYAACVRHHVSLMDAGPKRDELEEYAGQVEVEANKAAAVACKIPD